jgi:xylose isomerase
VCEEGVDVAKQLGAPTVKLWPGQDGFDYPFQADYAELWRLELDGVRSVAEMDPSVRVAIEYKFKEPRTHISFSTAARTLLGIETIGRDDIGIVVDLGHSLFAKETPADALQLVHAHDRLYTIEVNDNWREWDDDMAVGSVHLIETLEFFLAVRKIGWDQPILLDQFPFREDPVEAARASLDTIRAIDRALDRLDLDALTEAQERQDALAAQRRVMELLLGEVGAAAESAR